MSLRWLYPHVPHSFPTESFLPFSSPAWTIIPLQLQAIWSHSVGALRARWTTTCHWRLQMQRSCRARTTTPPPCILHSPAHPAPPTTIGWKAKAAHPSKPCRMTSALAGRAYSSAGQAASALHSMAVLQVFQAKLPHSMDESNPNPAAFSELRSVTDLALRATKITAQAIGRFMAHLLVLERHLWLNLTEMKDADKVPFLESPVSPTSLFGPAVEDIAEQHRSRPRQCDTSCLSAPAVQLLQLSSQ